MKKLIKFSSALLLSILGFVAVAQDLEFDDANLEQAIIDAGVDTNSDGVIQISEAEAIDSLNISDKGIRSLQHIEAFANLIYLDCSFNTLNSINTSSNQKLQYLDCTRNRINSIIGSSNGSIEELICSGNILGDRFDLRNLSNLKKLSCSFNSITGTISFTPFPELEYLDCSNNSAAPDNGLGLESIFIRNCPNLRTLLCDNNDMRSLDTSNNPLLEVLDCSQNIFLFTLDLRNNTNLLDVSARSINLTNIDITRNTKLKSLNLFFNDLAIIDLSQNPDIEILDLSLNLLPQVNISHLDNLTSLKLSSNTLSAIDISQNVLLQIFEAESNDLQSIDFSNNPMLREIDCSRNELNLLNLNNNKMIEDLDCSNNKLITLDLSFNRAASIIDCRSNELERINIKNGIEESLIRFDENENLQYICVDSFETAAIEMEIQNLAYNTQINSFCFSNSDSPYLVKGKVYFDLNDNNCTNEHYPIEYASIDIADENESGLLISNNNGVYSNHVPEGTYEWGPIASNDYFISNPVSTIAVFPEDGFEIEENFCLQKTQSLYDLSVVLVPTTIAIPGFESEYKLIYQNNGNEIIDAQLNLMYNNELAQLQLTSTTPNTESEGLLSWNIDQLLPQSSGSIDLKFILNTPMDTPPLNGEDVLRFKSSIGHTNDEKTPNDNVACLDQIVVNSFDPNDIQCLEGETVTEAYIGEFVHYKIRFENIGTAPAVNVRITDLIDPDKFDIGSVQLVDASHEIQTQVINENELEFLFENILLPFEMDSNQGYLVYKIRTSNNLKVGDLFDNQAEIFFDFNFPIITNISETEIELISSTNQLIETAIVNIFPNPTQNFINITSESKIQSVSIYNSAGILIDSNRYNDMLNVELSLEELNSTIYLISIETSEGTDYKKVFKN